ncbi:hypothetical protein COCON_G00119750 [Conger conger]|uniref:Uncharacterized protein n=1 Tax=Conger conger TaxID=82655 RepID=A0A9Q1DGJ2_CONCO|nr:hypothetical protein COCON_G00119750 [Conger conger]
MDVGLASVLVTGFVAVTIPRPCGGTYGKPQCSSPLLLKLQESLHYGARAGERQYTQNRRTAQELHVFLTNSAHFSDRHGNLRDAANCGLSTSSQLSSLQPCTNQEAGQLASCAGWLRDRASFSAPKPDPALGKRARRCFFKSGAKRGIPQRSSECCSLRLFPQNTNTAELFQPYSSAAGYQR